MATKQATGRLGKEYAAIEKSPPPFVYARPTEANILEWHFVMRGPPETSYTGGEYYGTLVFPPQYPFAPPGIKMITPSGRFQPGRKICTSMSDYHPGSWNPAWSVATILTGLLSFMIGDEFTAGSIRTTDQEKKTLAARSHQWNLSNQQFTRMFPEYSEGPNPIDLPNMGEQPSASSSTSSSPLSATSNEDAPTVTSPTTTADESNETKISSASKTDPSPISSEGLANLTLTEASSVETPTSPIVHKLPTPTSPTTATTFTSGRGGARASKAALLRQKLRDKASTSTGGPTAPHVVGDGTTTVPVPGCTSPSCPTAGVTSQSNNHNADNGAGAGVGGAGTVGTGNGGATATNATTAIVDTQTGGSPSVTVVAMVLLAGLIFFSRILG